AVMRVTACATVPAGPSVVVLPGQGKGFDQFQNDDAMCRQWATHQTGTSPGQGAAQSTIGGAAIGTLLGAAAGALVGAAAGRPGTGAAVGAGVGLVGGTAVGASNAGPTYGSLQRLATPDYTLRVRRPHALNEAFRTILCIAAHPDDIEFTIAGSVARWTGEGRTVVFCLVTTGGAGTNEYTPSGDGLIPRRERE